MATWPEARAGRTERMHRQEQQKRRRHLMRRGPACPRCEGPTCAIVVEATGDPVHPGCYTVDEEPR